MKKLSSYKILIITILLISIFSSCEDDCMKTIDFPQFYNIGNQQYSYSTEQEVPCDFEIPEPEDLEQIDPPALENFSYEILNFDYSTDVENNTTRLQYEIELINPNDYDVVGIPIITIKFDGLQSRGNFSSICNQISANSSCILTFDQEESLDLGAHESIEITLVEYFLTD